MFYHNELFYRLQTVAADQRPKLYQQACRLAQHSAVVVTTSEQNCSMWLSLRSNQLPQFVKDKSGLEQ